MKTDSGYTLFYEVEFVDNQKDHNFDILCFHKQTNKYFLDIWHFHCCLKPQVIKHIVNYAYKLQLNTTSKNWN